MRAHKLPKPLDRITDLAVIRRFVRKLDTHRPDQPPGVWIGAGAVQTQGYGFRGNQHVAVPEYANGIPI